VTDEIHESRAENERLTRDAEAIAAKAKAGKALVMKRLRDCKLSACDIGQLTGVSHQRVSQIVRAGRETYSQTRSGAIPSRRAEDQEAPSHLRSAWKFHSWSLTPEPGRTRGSR
jgi:hypothetical protein